MRNLKKKGFTIVELVIVIAVIAVLAAVLIPTFSNLIKKANESVDIQLVRNMNVILEQDEALNGKPADTDKVKEILAKNGIVNPTPALAESAFAWDSEENLIILINNTTQKGVFPKEYKDVDYKSTWKLLAGTVNVTMESLGATLEEAINNAEFGQTIVLSSDQELNVTSLPKNLDIDLNGKKLTLTNGLPMEENSNIALSNGEVETDKQITVVTGASITLSDIEFKSNNSCAIFPMTASCVNIKDSTIISNCPIGTNYSDKTSRAITVNITNTTLGSAEEPCGIGIMMITSGDITISECTIYATGTGILDRAGNVVVKDTVINYMPNKAYSDTYFAPVSAETTYAGATPGSVRQQMWDNGSGGFCAPIVVGDFWAKHYSFDANCTLINVTVVNNTEYEYPDVYLSQENYDVFKWLSDVRKPDFNNKVAGDEIVKTTLTCDDTITWAVNPGKNDVFINDCVDGMEPFADYAGFGYSNSGYGGVAVLYVDNVFVNGVEQAKGSTSSTPIPAN